MLPLPPHRIPPRGAGRISSRQRVVAQWRRLDFAPLETSRTDRARVASTVLPKVLSELRITQRQTETEVVKVWNHALDPNIVAHAQPTGLRKGTLFVSVDSSVWLSEIVRYRRKEILDRLQNSFSRELISRISFRVG
jgi:predicted nucleic acid-binding Zn ribbon protein